MSYNIEDIIKILKSNREELNLSLRDLAEKTKISASTLQRYETGETVIPLDRFQIICNALSLDAEKLLMTNVKKIPPFTKMEYINKIEEVRKEKGLSKNEARNDLKLTEWIHEKSNDDIILKVMTEWKIPIAKNSFYLSNNKNSILFKLQAEFIDKTNGLSEEEAQKIKDSIMPIIDLLVNKKID
ncbi:helix-turn-helix transcriptional regulator [Fusobacterium nucleatum]|uniref:helix-turn-helix domain-containing protein n=1 Tax=Fusobacterium nucleatum TaxID=851 RepID=UPI0030CF8CBC